MTKRNRAQRREAWAAATPKAIEKEFQKVMKERFGGNTAPLPDLFGRAQASSKEIADAMHQRRGRIEQG